MSVVQSWRSWWSGGGDKEKEEDEEKSQETSEEKEDKEESTSHTIPPAWVKGFGDLVQSVGSYATTLTETVKTKVSETASGTIVGEFQRQQDEFARSQQRQRDATVPPWVGYNEEEQMKAQILELSADSRNVLRDPPPGVEFPFDYRTSAPVAIATMSEDQRLKALRFDLVPKKISEEMFWRNYFYRVSLIKQSLQLSSLATAEPSTPSASGSSHQPLTGEEGSPSAIPPPATTTTDLDVSTDEFASDQPFNRDAVSREAVQSELDQLGVSETTAEDAWEAELQADLEGLDLAATGGNGDGVSGAGGDDWEEELQQMLELHSTDDTNP